LGFACFEAITLGNVYVLNPNADVRSELKMRKKMHNRDGKMNEEF
jgi:hypothetical protein